MASDMLDVGFFGALRLGPVFYLSDRARTASPGGFSLCLVWSRVSNVGISVYWIRLLLPGFGPGRCCPDEPDSTISIGVSGTRRELDFGRTDRPQTLGGAGAAAGGGSWSAMGDAGDMQQPMNDKWQTGLAQRRQRAQREMTDG